MSGASVAVAEPPTLASLCADLGEQLLSVRAAPNGTGAPVATPVIHAAREALVAGPGDVVLAVGVQAGEADARSLVSAAGAAEAAAVVVKHGAGVDDLATAAGVAGVALLTTSTAVAWGQLFALIRTATSAPRHPTGRSVASGAIGDLFVLADAIASAAGGPVTIEDPQSRVLAFSNLGGPIDEPRAATILGRQVPEGWRRRLLDAGVFERLRRSDGVIRVDFDGAAPRRAVAVRGGGTLLASVWVSEGERPLTDVTDTVLEEAARIAAVHLLRHQVDDDLERRVRGDLLGAALRGQADSSRLARELGVATDALVIVVAVQTVPDEGVEAAGMLVDERLVAALAVYFQAFRRKVSVAAHEGRVYVLVAGRRDGSRERLVTLVRDAVASAAKSVGVGLRAGVGTPVEGLDRIPTSRGEADLALRLASAGAVVDIDDAHGEALLLRLRDVVGVAPRPLSRPLRRLAEQDAAGATAYLPTLRAWLDNVGDPARVAAALHVHPNTVRYRLRRIQEIAEVDLHDPGQRFPLELQLRLGDA